MSREEYTPPDLTATNNQASSSTNKEPPTTSTTSHLSLGIDFSRDDRGGKPLLSTAKPYDASELRYYHSDTTREEANKKVKWQCVECEEIHRFGPTDYLRMDLGWRTFIAR
ncbi:hypothetical protein PRZ48_008557 [Zasmidium cellare]|uniref:Uncharacterized protein n=1 Tax=Zasmidium cellare TaxID=395010 RepID=A0ABR0EGX5_ZASCE|nr:hypothetical protein PRZ48_008557 [Zasmidium cellare]